MSIVSPVTIAWQRVTNENTSNSKEIERFSQLEPAIRRAREVILAARDTQDSDFKGSDPEAHITLHPGDFQYGDALTQQDLDNIYITMLPGAITQDSSETFPADSTTNVADMNSFASRIFFAESESEFIFDSNVTVRGDFSFRGSIVTIKLDKGEIQGGFRVENKSGGSSFLYDTSDQRWISQSDTQVQGKLSSTQGIEISGETIINGNGQPVQISGVGGYSVSSESYDLSVTNAVSKQAKDFDVDASNGYNLSADSFDITGTSNGTVQAQDLSLEGEIASVESTSGNLNLASSDDILISSPNGKVSASGGEFESVADNHVIDSSTGTVAFDDYSISADTFTTTITSRYEIAQSDPTATFTVGLPTTFASNAQFNGNETSIKNLNATESFAVSADNPTFDANGSLDITSGVFSVDSSDIGLNGQQTGISGKNLLELNSDSEILIEALGAANPSINLKSKLIKANPTDQFKVSGSSQFEGEVTIASGNSLTAEDNIFANGYIESPEIRASNTSAGEVLFAGSSLGNVVGDANLTYDTADDTLGVENISIEGTLETSSLDVDSLTAGSASIDAASITSLDANTADFSSVQVDGINENQIVYVDSQSKLNGSFDLEFDPSTQTFSTRNLEASSDATIGGNFALSTGTSVNEIRTSVRTGSGGSDDALVTESGVAQAIKSETSSDTNYGTATFSGDGSKKEFRISHGFNSEPGYWNVLATTEDGSGISHVTADSADIIVEYDTAPPSGTDNIVLNWLAI